MPETYKLEDHPWLVKELAQDIEKSGKTRSEFRLCALVEAKNSIYGTKGSAKRTAIQKKFQQFKEKTPANYVKFLDKINVVPGKGVERELRLEQERQPAPTVPPDSPSVASYSSVASDKKSTANSPAPSVASPEKSIQSLKTPSPHTTPAVISYADSENPLPSFDLLRITMKPSETVLQQVYALETFKQDGSPDYPFIVIVNPDRPECNWGFEVQLVENIEHRNFNRSVYYIRHVTGVGQEFDWEATIPKDKYPELAGRVVEFRKPSQHFFHQTAERYHQEKHPCQATKNAHSSLQTSIKQEPHRAYAYWLLVFPRGTKLENYTFSDDAVIVKTGNKNLIDDYTYPDGEEVEVTGVGVFWRIALAGGTMISSPEPTPTKARFVRRNKPKKKGYEIIQPEKGSL